QMIGTTPLTRTIQFWSAGRAGSNSMYLDLFQNANDPIQIDLSPGVLNTDPTPQPNDSWAAGLGSGGGVPIVRGSTPFHVLTGICPVHSPGVYSGVDLNDPNYMEVV